jgi:hypothetical protein
MPRDENLRGATQINQIDLNKRGNKKQKLSLHIGVRDISHGTILLNHKTGSLNSINGRNPGHPNITSNSQLKDVFQLFLPTGLPPSPARLRSQQKPTLPIFVFIY